MLTLKTGQYTNERNGSMRLITIGLNNGELVIGYEVFTLSAAYIPYSGEVTESSVPTSNEMSLEIAGCRITVSNSLATVEAEGNLYHYNLNRNGITSPELELEMVNDISSGYDVMDKVNILSDTHTLTFYAKGLVEDTYVATEFTEDSDEGRWLLSLNTDVVLKEVSADWLFDQKRKEADSGITLYESLLTEHIAHARCLEA